MRVRGPKKLATMRDIRDTENRRYRIALKRIAAQDPVTVPRTDPDGVKTIARLFNYAVSQARSALAGKKIPEGSIYLNDPTCPHGYYQSTRDCPVCHKA